jgi:hypothetical protein
VTTDRKSAGIGKGTPGPGRGKGNPNKLTVEFRETVRQLLDDNRENVGRWLTLVAEGDGTDKGAPDPAKALDLLAKLAEFAAPKLGRTEHVGDGGGPVKAQVTVEFITTDATRPNT